MNFTGLLDLVDGGGAGRAGQQFEGARVSEILNAIGIKPYGAEDRMRAVRPQARPEDFRQQFTPPIQAPSPMQPPMQPPMSAMPPPVMTTPLPPAGAMPNEELMRLIQMALSNYNMPSGIGYGPR